MAERAEEKTGSSLIHPIWNRVEAECSEPIRRLSFASPGYRAALLDDNNSPLVRISITPVGGLLLVVEITASAPVKSALAELKVSLYVPQLVDEITFDHIPLSSRVFGGVAKKIL